MTDRGRLARWDSLAPPRSPGPAVARGEQSDPPPDGDAEDGADQDRGGVETAGVIGV